MVLQPIVIPLYLHYQSNYAEGKKNGRVTQNKMKLTSSQEKRISELTHAMEIESANNFPNGDLWNKMSDTIFCIKTYGQEKPLTDILDSDGIVIGQKYDNGTELYFEGMTFDNSY